MVFVTLLRNYQIVMFERTFDDCLNLPQVERLHQVIERAETQSTDRALDGLHAADHYHDGVRRDFFDMWDHVQAAHTGHGDVANHQLEIAFLQTRKRLLCRSRSNTFVLFTEQIGEDLGYFDFIINYQNAGRHNCRHVVSPETGRTWRLED